MRPQDWSRQCRSRTYDAVQTAVRAEVFGSFETGSLLHRLLLGADHGGALRGKSALHG